MADYVDESVIRFAGVVDEQFLQSYFRVSRRACILSRISIVLFAGISAEIAVRNEDQ